MNKAALDILAHVFWWSSHSIWRPGPVENLTQGHITRLGASRKAVSDISGPPGTVWTELGLLNLLTSSSQVSYNHLQP